MQSKSPALCIADAMGIAINTHEISEVVSLLENNIQRQYQNAVKEGMANCHESIRLGAVFIADEHLRAYSWLSIQEALRMMRQQGWIIDPITTATGSITDYRFRHN